MGEPQSEVTLIYGNRFFSGIIFREQLEDMKDSFLGRFRVFHVLSGEPNEIPLFHGRIDAEKLAQLHAAAQSDANLMPHILNCVEAYATLGEIADTLRNIFGEYQG